MVQLFHESWILLINVIMISIYNIDIDNVALKHSLKRLQGATFKLLPAAEEGADYKKPLETIIVELLGMQKLIPSLDPLVTLSCKLRGLMELDIEKDFLLYRRSIFECCGLLDKIASTLD